MADLQLFRVIRGIRRTILGRFDKAHAWGGDTSVSADPYDLHTLESVQALLRRLADEQPQAFKGLSEALAVVLSWSRVASLTANDIRTAAESVANNPVVALASEGPLPSSIDDIDAWLLGHSDAPEPEDLRACLESRCKERGTEVPASSTLQEVAHLTVTHHFWMLDRLRIGIAMIVAMHRANSTAAIGSRGALTRYAMVASLIETIAARGLLRNDAREIFELLHRRPLAFGSELLKARRRVSNLARRPGVADLLVVRQKWSRYQLGELAAVEPVMPGESKERLFERVSESETKTTTTTSTSSKVDRENKSTLSSEISSLLKTATQEKAGVEGWLNVESQMATTKVSSHVGADYSYSGETERESTARHASEIVESVVSSIEENMSVTREQRRSETVTDRTVHKLENPDSTPVNGVYRWVDRVNRIELVRFPNRFVFEVQIPEPAAWLRWLMRGATDRGLRADPGPFPNNIMADAISSSESSPTYYLALGRQFGADELPPPPMPVVIAEQTKGPESGEQAASFGLESSFKVSIPDGYVASTWRAMVMGTPSDYRDPQMQPRAIIALGAGEPQRLVSAAPTWMRDLISGPVGPINRGAIPIAITRHDMLEYVVNFEITCVPSPESMLRWQMEVLATLRAAHERRRAAYAEARAREEIQRATAPVAGNPIRNRELMIAELKRLSIEMLTDTRLRGTGGMEFPNPQDAPVLNRAAARESAAEIQFIEQAFEWSTMSFAFYPTYWTVESRWPELVALEESDPEFAAFLRSGSARVIIPVRPGYESQAQLFVDYGIIWGGGTAPGPDESGYVSVAAEIEELQRGPGDGEVLRSWFVTLPTNLVALDSTGGFPMANPGVPQPT